MLSSCARRLLSIVHQWGGDVARFSAEGMLLLWVYDETKPGAARAAAITACRCMTQLRELDQMRLHSDPSTGEAANAAVPPPPLSPSGARGARRQAAKVAAAAIGRESIIGPRAAARRRPATDRRTEALRRAAFEAGSFDALNLGERYRLEGWNVGYVYLW
jgi:hypothetical protein